MKIGIIADTHDNIANIRKALELFKKKGINFFIHAGDYVAPFTLSSYFEMGFDFVGVFGNNDGEKKGLKEKSKDKIKDAPYLFSYSGKNILIVHDLAAVGNLVNEKNPSVVIYAHTHNPEIRREGKTLFINPGEAGGWLTGRATVAVLDLGKLEAEIIPLD